MFKLVLLVTFALANNASAGLPGLPRPPQNLPLPIPVVPVVPPTGPTYVVTMAKTTDQIIQQISNTAFATREDKLNAFTAALKQHAAITQAPLMTLLASLGIPKEYIQSSWITNQVFIRGLAATALDVIYAQLLKLGITSINPEKIVNLITPDEFDMDPTANSEWGIVKIQAPEASEIADGTGIRVGSIDSGVRATHEALRDSFIQNYGWFDPYHGLAQPYDTVGHGTHVMGSLLGKGIGVAQGATWLTCLGCYGESCLQSALTACGQFMLCPTKPDGTSAPDCSNAPHIINNSWGGTGGDSSYDYIIKAWLAVDIFPTFAAGNGGPTCNTIVSPADSLVDVIAVGSTTNIDSVDPTSSHGPTVYGTIKPDIGAPGFLIRSAYNTSDDAYASGTGTSMATPHVTGTIAIMLSADNSLKYPDIKKHLIAGVDTTVIKSTATNCGGIANNIPNNDFGNGRCNALKSVKSVLGLP